MAKKQMTPLETSRAAAQYFTMTVAVLAGIFWVITSLSNDSSTAIDDISNLLYLAVTIGGIAMGLLYVVYLQNKKK